MSNEPLTADSTTQEIRDHMGETRTHLSRQVEALESEVMNVFHNATDAVTHTIENATEAVSGVTTAVSDTIHSVQDKVGETVHSVEHSIEGAMTSVRHALDVPGHLRRHPWLLVTGAVVVGYLCGAFFFRRR